MLPAARVLQPGQSRPNFVLGHLPSRQFFTDGKEAEGGLTVGLLARPAVKKLLEQVSTATW